jgi:hypothetical protein
MPFLGGTALIEAYSTVIQAVVESFQYVQVSPGVVASNQRKHKIRH